ncbi:hypothetical protein [Xanthomonas sp. MUS 060]|uniref:hypothetical protein n=1 Tax=Xanthomonas sp. MUS 060 TaxID=1588031 RepID=UPI001269B171|nr:hypothetical protein [Xanthomonas sp. MUS 060]
MERASARLAVTGVPVSAGDAPFECGHVVIVTLDFVGIDAKVAVIACTLAFDDIAGHHRLEVEFALASTPKSPSLPARWPLTT